MHAMHAHAHRWLKNGARHEPDVVCLHCGVIARLEGADAGMFTCPVSGTTQAFQRLIHMPCLATGRRTVDECYGQEMMFLSLPHDAYTAHYPRDCSRAAVLACGYASSSGDDDGEQHLYNPSLWDKDDNYLGTEWDEAPLQYVPPSMRNPIPGRSIKRDMVHASAIEQVHQ
jgi:hypothetical protein